MTAAASAHASIVSDGPAAGCRALEIRVSSGLDIRLLPDRGLDIGEAWFRGTPLAWISAVGETGPLPQPRGTDWNDAFGGGLVTTCGLRNVGAPSEGHGQHGTYSHLRAREVRVEHAGDEVVARARIVDASAIGHRLEVEREVRTRVGAGHVTITDVTTNLGPDTEAVPLLYHVNLGPPLWVEGSQLRLNARATHPRDSDAQPFADSWHVAPGLEPDAPERVFEHEVTPGADGWCSATVAGAGLELDLRWDAATMPRMWQWVHPAYGVLGLEPANCSVLGVAHDRAEGRLPELAPGEERRTRLQIRVRPSL